MKRIINKTIIHAVAVDAKAHQFLDFQSLVGPLHLMKYRSAFASTELRRYGEKNI